jgi:hypothetical protein
MRPRITASVARSIEQEASDLITALRDLGDDDLAGRLWRCQRHRIEKKQAQQAGIRTGWPAMCRSVACPSCRRWLGRTWRERASSRFMEADSTTCSHATIMLACTGDLDVVHDVVRDLRVALRNLRDRSASRARRWATVEAYGLVEVDAHHADDLALLPPRRREVVQELPVLGHGPVVWVPHAHICLHHPHLDRHELRDALRVQWSGHPGRVDVEPFKAGEADLNAANIVGYAAKMTMMTTYKDGLEESWPVTWRATYWSWLCGLRAGLAPLRLRMGPMHSRPISIQQPARAEIEPMPVLFG